MPSGHHRPAAEGQHDQEEKEQHPRGEKRPALPPLSQDRAEPAAWFFRPTPRNSRDPVQVPCNPSISIFWVRPPVFSGSQPISNLGWSPTYRSLLTLSRLPGSCPHIPSFSLVGAGGEPCLKDRVCALMGVSGFPHPRLQTLPQAASICSER